MTRAGCAKRRGAPLKGALHQAPQPIDKTLAEVRGLVLRTQRLLAQIVA
jgi:hypothetical protein